MDTFEQRKGEARHARGLALVDSLRQDVSYAFRALRKSPGFSAVAILSLALGIGANTTIFTFVNAVLLRPLPYPDSERIVTLRERVQTSGATVNVHPANFVEWHARARSFEALALGTLRCVSRWDLMMACGLVHSKGWGSYSRPEGTR